MRLEELPAEVLAASILPPPPETVLRLAELRQHLSEFSGTVTLPENSDSATTRNLTDRRSIWKRAVFSGASYVKASGVPRQRNWKEDAGDMAKEWHKHLIPRLKRQQFHYALKYEALPKQLDSIKREMRNRASSADVTLGSIHIKLRDGGGLLLANVDFGVGCEEVDYDAACQIVIEALKYADPEADRPISVSRPWSIETTRRAGRDRRRDRREQRGEVFLGIMCLKGFDEIEKAMTELGLVVTRTKDEEAPTRLTVWHPKMSNWAAAALVSLMRADKELTHDEYTGLRDTIAAAKARSNDTEALTLDATGAFNRVANGK